MIGKAGVKIFFYNKPEEMKKRLEGRTGRKVDVDALKERPGWKQNCHYARRYTRYATALSTPDTDGGASSSRSVDT